MKTLVICLALSALVLTGCVGNLAPTLVSGSGLVTTETRTVSNFNAVSLSGIGDVTITQGDTEALTIEAEDNFMPYLKTEVNGGTLTISVDNRNGTVMFRPTKPIRFTLAVKNLQAIHLSGAGRIASDSLKSDQLTIGISGAGSITLDRVEATNVSSTLSGAGSLKVGGKVTSQAATLSGVGGYEAPNLSSQTARVNVSGAGGATVWAQESLDVTISGVGSVSYYGSPRVQQTRSGVGNVKSLGDKKAD